MSTEQTQGGDELQSTKERREAEPETDEHHQVVDAPDPPEPTEKPEVTDEHKEKAKEMRKDYEEDRETVTMPGTDGAVSGTAVNEWIDDEGNPKFSEEGKKDPEQSENQNTEQSENQNTEQSENKNNA